MEWVGTSVCVMTIWFLYDFTHGLELLYMPSFRDVICNGIVREESYT